MELIHRGGIWDVRWGKREKRRFVVVQNDVMCQHLDTVIVAPVCSAVSADPIVVAIGRSEMVNLSLMTTIKKERFLKKVGEITEPQQMQIDDALRVSLGLGLD